MRNYDFAMIIFEDAGASHLTTVIQQVWTGDSP